VNETGDWDLFLGPLQWARAHTGELTDCFDIKGDLQGFPKCINPRILGISTVRFHLKNYSQREEEKVILFSFPYRPKSAQR